MKYPECKLAHVNNNGLKKSQQNYIFVGGGRNL
jgi:hypothetical protein